MISIRTAAQLLDFGGRISREAADEQLRGAVALHNILEEKRVAYLADEVGMGKTFVALGALALFRHFDPTFRVLVIAPRENIQKKWIKELGNFVANHVRFPDLRVKALHGAPARASVLCASLVDLVRETALDADRDFFARLPSFSLPLGKDSGTWGAKRDELLAYLPWADPALFDLRSKESFKDNFARGVCCALPTFDLVIVDEGHNLKGGFGESASSRNRVIARVFGHSKGAEDGTRFPHYRRRAERVLFLSATPLEDDYRQLWNQLDVFGLGGAAPVLKDQRASDEAKRESAREFLIRRVTSLTVAGNRMTKNLYRREWRQGGVSSHDDPLEVPDERQRLTVALVQKKVSEVLQSERFNNSFQIGMLASFESFLETAKVQNADDHSDASNFDGEDQTEIAEERLGVDVHSVNRLARDYRRKFGKELPHPKMDALVAALARSFATGRKALVFVRRVASVKELQRKLEECYDAHVFARLRQELRPQLQPRLETLIAQYSHERADRRHSAQRVTEEHPDDEGPIAADLGGIESFFAWFFRGEGPARTLSGAVVQRRFNQASAAYSTVFEDNHVGALLGVDTQAVWESMVAYCGRPAEELAAELQRRSGSQLKRARKHPRKEAFLATQHAAISLLAEISGPVQGRARVILHERYREGPASASGAFDGPDPRDWLNTATFWTELRKRPRLRSRLWPERKTEDIQSAFREQELRRELFSAMARLGNPIIDLYVLVVNRIGKMDLRSRDQERDDGETIIAEFLNLLEQQSTSGGPGLTSFSELAEAAYNFDLIIDLNATKVRSDPLSLATTTFGALLGKQQPVGGMFGAINETLVRQFRMPGYPIVLITTDLLQEGEDLHTFCSDVYHYGISWMPSSMEQRIGRIDRVSSQTERRLTQLAEDPAGQELLQVYYPHLRETVEVLQVDRVLERVNRFLRLMHERFGATDTERPHLDVASEILRTQRATAPIKEALETAFPVTSGFLGKGLRPLAITPSAAAELYEGFCELPTRLSKELNIEWEPRAKDNALIGTARLAHRHQPFTLLLRSIDGLAAVRCVSPIGQLYPEFAEEEIADALGNFAVRIAATYDERFDTYDLTVESDVLLGPPEYDARRVRALVEQVVRAADVIELTLLGVDESMGTFRSDLELETTYER